MTTTVFMVAEKPMLSESIAEILSNGNFKKRKGWNGVCSVCEYHGEFLGRKSHFKVTSTCGHVMSLDFPKKYNDWKNVDPIELFTAQIQKKETNPAMKMNEFLASEAGGCDYVVLWLDCDKEGENICFEVISAIEKSIKTPRSGNVMDNIFRARFSAINQKDIKSAMNKLVQPNLNESLSVDARQELDLRIGCAFTRFQTQYFQGKYGDLDSTCISFGPCQTPTLAFCVTRHDLITEFKSEPYWILQVKFETERGQQIEPQYSRGRIFDRNVCQLFYDRLKKADKGVVTSISSEESQKNRPCALNTVEMLRVASSGLGLSPSTAMAKAEYLYTRGFISYPRTETTTYSPNFDFRDVLGSYKVDVKYGEVVRELLLENMFKPRAGEDKGDHPPITPVRPNDGSLSGDALKLYEYITQHFIASLMKPCKFRITTLRITVLNEVFEVFGKTIVNAGFTRIMRWMELNEGLPIPSLSVGDQVFLKDIKIQERVTEPPDYLTESQLITLMEEHGIGTDASIPVHINNIGQRNYVIVKSGRRLYPTKLGIALIHGYRKIDPELIFPTMRSEVEKQLNLIAKNLAEFSMVTNHVLENFRLKFIYFLQNIRLVDSLFEDSFTTLAQSGKPFSRCGKCRRFMKLVASKPQRLHCSNCQDTYSIPLKSEGIIKLYGEKKCPLDGFDLLYWQGDGGKLSVSFGFCPYCTNYPPFEGMEKGASCHECPHPTCLHSYMTQGVGQCVSDSVECSGTLVLDTHSCPKWRLRCNQCLVFVDLFHGANKVKVLEEECSVCSAHLVMVEYRGQSLLPNGKTEHEGCIFCDENLSHLVDITQGNVPNNDNSRYNKGRSGRRRGRRQRRPRGRTHIAF